ncbi:hypothetical protein R4U18_001632 [Salmonella enterica]|nr:hypothetical protein [Salmonella enterica]EIP3426201.1 hypothetical protein [Salmonella enterica]ELR9965626.1 hypothetical protein [Salmonella enterica]HCA3616082.1 hypothetical protein [Salmonella enterica subsp. diarizonae serovar 61:i:z]
MSENIEIENTSTELFYDLAKRSFEASGKKMQDMCSDSISYLVDDADFMSTFIRLTINHICHNFDTFTKQEGNQGNLDDVNYEEVAERLVRNAWIFC